MTDLGLKFIYGIPAANPLVRDYLAGKPQALEFYGGRHDDPERILRLADSVDSRLERACIADLLRSQDTFGLVAGGSERLERFEREGGFIVTTGQQPVLFGGPLYILYKALTAVNLAACLERILGAPVLPVFWNASEDHDYAEVASFVLLDSYSIPHTLALPARPGNRQPVCLIQPGADLDSLFTQFETLLPESGFRAWLSGCLREGYAPDASLGQAFSRYLAALLAGHGLFVMDACSPGLRELSRELFERELLDSSAGLQALERASQSLKASGYPLQINPLAGDTNLFLIQAGEREKLRVDGDAFALKHSGAKFSRAEILDRLAEEPTVFSPGVLLRPLVESRVFGSLCYVAGPGEMSYYAQMGGLYDLRGLERPVIWPRLSGFLVENKVGRVLDKYGLSVEQLSLGAKELARRLAAADPAVQAVTARLELARKSAEEILGGIKPLAAGIDPTLEGPVEHSLQAIGTVLEKLEKKITAAARRADETRQSQIEKASSNLWPGGAPQERVIAAAQYLVRYGPEFLDFVSGSVRLGLG